MTAAEITAPAIELRGLRKSFGRNEVLKGIDLSIAPRQVVCIIGASGSGKSTLLRCVNRLEEPTGGQVLIDGIDITHPDCDLDLVRQNIGMVFQHFNLFPHMTALENVVEAPIRVKKVPRREAVERGRDLLARVGLSAQAGHYPAQLSGGQQQRAAIARALAIQPLVMLFDEPTSALDPELVGEVLTVIGDLAKEKRTMILVTHEMKFAREVASHVVFLHNGLIEEQGPPVDMFGAPKSERLKKFISSIH